MASDQPWTIGRLLQWTTDYFRQHSSPSPRLDAEVLLAAAHGCERIDLYTAFDQVASSPTREQFRELVRRRAAGEPVAYLVGHREFFSLPLTVTPDVLIPRPETELLVMTALDAIKAYPVSEREIEVADVGTGSGAIAVSIAKHAASVRVTATDISPAALEVANRNTARLGLEEKVTLVESDLLAGLCHDRRFDFVASNPPYVSRDELAELPPEIKNFEPHQALVAGQDGAEVIQRLVPQAADRLYSGGAAMVEISPMIELRVCEIFQGEERFEPATIIKDLAGLPRVVAARRR